MSRLEGCLMPHRGPVCKIYRSPVATGWPPPAGSVGAMRSCRHGSAVAKAFQSSAAKQRMPVLKCAKIALPVRAAAVPEAEDHPKQMPSAVDTPMGEPVL